MDNPMAPTRTIFKRKALAEELVRALAGETIADYSSGMFLAAPRRTGKSTFLKNDLIPECAAREWLPVYVDLWVNQEANPADLISGAIAEALSAYESGAQKLAKRAGVDKINLLRTLSWDFTKPQLPAGTSLAKALEVLHKVSEKMIVLIVDEAQHALNSQQGITAMFALKAARDQLNQSADGDKIRMVFTGSSRDKLANLVLKRDQPFYGASITPFPLLGRDFVESFTEELNTRLASTNQFQADDIEEAFQLVGNRPEMLIKLVAEVSVGLGEASNLGELLRTGALNHQAGVWSDYESSYNDLNPIQQAVLEVMAERAVKKLPYAPFSEQSVKDVARKLELADTDTKASTPNIQNALNALREKELVWKSNRGEYALEDSAMAVWLTRSPGDR